MMSAIETARTLEALGFQTVRVNLPTFQKQSTHMLRLPNSAGQKKAGGPFGPPAG